MLSARATDSDGTISYVDFFANTNRVRRVFGSPTNATYTAVWSNAPAGTFELRAVAVDNAGASGVSETVRIVVGGGETNPPPVNAAPVATWIAPTNGSTFPAGSLIFPSARASDSDGTVSYVDFFRNGEQFRRAYNSSTSGVYTVSWSNALAGTYELRAVAVDNAGATGASETVRIVIGGGGETNPPPSNVPPVATWVAPTNGSTFAAGTTILLRARATDSDGTVSYVDFFRNGDQFRRSYSPLSDGIYTVAWSNALAGTYELRAVAVDNAGATGGSETVRIVVGGGETNPPPVNVAPVATWIAPTNGSAFPAGSLIFLSARATDSDGTVSFVDFLRNGEQFRRAYDASTSGVYTVWHGPTHLLALTSFAQWPRTMRERRALRRRCGSSSVAAEKLTHHRAMFRQSRHGLRQPTDRALRLGAGFC